jgi:hypothetical protein
MDPDSHGECVYGAHQCQAYLYSSIGVVFAGLRVAKVHDAAIVKILGDIALKTVYDLRTRALGYLHRFVEVFRVERLGKCRL